LYSLSPSEPVARGVNLLTNTTNNNDVVRLKISSDRDVVPDKFSSFMFWRQPLPTVELDDLASVLPSFQGSHLTSDTGHSDFDATSASDFDEFNYWRVPIMQLDIDDLLHCLCQL